MKQTNIPLAKAAFRSQFTRALIRNGLSPDYYFGKVGLPPRKNENPESLLPTRPFWLLVNMVAFEAGIPDFGAQVAELTPWHKVESLAPLIGNAKNLDELLRTSCKIARSQVTMGNFTLEFGESELWFGYAGGRLIKHDIQQELYRISSMIQLVQLATGANWHPEQVELMMRTNKVVKFTRLIRKSHISFSNPTSRISISNSLLELPVNLEKFDADHIKNQADISVDFIEIIRQLVSAFIRSKTCSISEISKATGMPVRTLQRQLKNHGTCFTDLLNQAKFSYATDKLQNSSATITEISVQLGYSDAAHFNHAFHRWAGISPSVFRAGIQ